MARHRNAGVGQAALAALPDLCRALGLRAVTVEVGLANAAAQKIYRRAGFEPAATRELLTLALAAPSHRL